MLTREQILFWLHKVRGIDVSDKDQCQRLIDCFVNAIYLYDDRMVLTFNYKEEIKHIPFDEVQSSNLVQTSSRCEMSSNGYFIAVNGEIIGHIVS